MKLYEGYNKDLEPRIVRFKASSPAAARKVLAAAGYTLMSRKHGPMGMYQGEGYHKANGVSGVHTEAEIFGSQS